MRVTPRTGLPMAHPDIPEPMPRTVAGWAWVVVQGVVVFVVAIALVWLFAIYGTATGTPPYAP